MRRMQTYAVSVSIAAMLFTACTVTCDERHGTEFRSGADAIPSVVDSTSIDHGTPDPLTDDRARDLLAFNDARIAFDELSAQRSQEPSGKSRWETGQTMLQGFLGATLFDKIERTGGSIPTADGSGESLAQIPSIGGGAQIKLGGNSIDLGVEAMLAFDWRANATAIVAGGGGAAVAVDVDMLLVDLYGGPFANLFLSDRVRVYAAAGPMMQWGQYDQSGPVLDGEGSGFGVGVYARTGIEAEIGSGSFVGLGVRWSNSTIDLDGGQGKLEMDGFLIALTVSHWY